MQLARSPSAVESYSCPRSPQPLCTGACPRSFQGSSVCSSPGLAVMSSPGGGGYTRNPYYAIEKWTYDDFASSYYENLGVYGRPFPAMGSQPLRQANTGYSAASSSSSTMDSPELIAGCLSTNDARHLYPQHKDSMQFHSPGTECVAHTGPIPHSMDEYHVLPSVSGTQSDFAWQAVTPYRLPEAATEASLRSRLSLDDQSDFGAPAAVGMGQSQLFSQWSCVAQAFAFQNQGVSDTPPSVPRCFLGQTGSSMVRGRPWHPQSMARMQCGRPPNAVLKFKRMLPPPIPYDIAVAVLSSDSRYAESLLVFSCLNWYSRIVALQELYAGGILNKSPMSGTNNRKPQYLLKKACPAPPEHSMRTEVAMRCWVWECNEWWEEEFGKKKRGSERRRGAAGGGVGGIRYRSRTYPSNYQWNADNNNGGNVNVSVSGTSSMHFGTGDESSRRGGRYHH
ncbi:hypothetical protein DQ04_06591020 [Trypanosoma grayi]|uniref:hypothetical protein n=1 Tax=Trypanosoma grayi TaxID=71804 RepID=UPI0004F403F2|nr:hypothetical protein DQ04_06591020 [Trypanosoma grayi]KEG08714.1 hypothetical protein DQ04_06591020 [Trypanosoma grayi]